MFSYKFYKLEYQCKAFHFFRLDALAGNECQKRDSQTHHKKDLLFLLMLLSHCTEGALAPPLYSNQPIYPLGHLFVF